MKEYIVYRDRDTKEITQYHPRREITEEQIKSYNEAQTGDNYVRKQIAEIVQVEEDSLLYYVMNKKEMSLSDYLSDLRDLEDSIDDIRSTLDWRLDDLEERIKAVEGEEE